MLASLINHTLQCVTNLANLTQQTQLRKPDPGSPTQQTEPSKSHQANQTYPSQPSKTNKANLSKQTQPSKPDSQNSFGHKILIFNLLPIQCITLFEHMTAYNCLE